MRRLYHETKERLAYEPPKSVSFGHQARTRNTRLAWAATAQFVNQRALFRLGPGITLDCYVLYDREDASTGKGRQEQARQLFGPEHASRSSAHIKHWVLAPDQLPAAIEFALDDDKWPKEEMGQTLLHFSYWFLWRDLVIPPRPGDDELAGLPWTDDWSSLGVSLGGRRLFLQPRLVFPFPYDSEEHLGFLAQVEPSLSFRLRDQYFKRALPSKNGGYGNVRKLDKNWRTPNRGVQPTPASGRG